MKLFHKKFGSGDPLLILHGLFGSSDNWYRIAKELAKTHTVYLLDMRNHGRSPHHKEMTYSAMVEDIYEFLTDFNLRKVTLIGHSMGGKTAMNFALGYPHRVNKLIVIDIAPKVYPILHDSIIESLVAIDIDNLSSRNEADEHLSKTLNRPELRQFLLKNLYRNEDDTFIWRINLPVISRNIQNLGEATMQDKRFDSPALFIKGELSDYILPRDEELIINIFPYAEITTVPEASHWVHAERPNDLVERIQKFLIKEFQT